jgi:hypothetical protein
VDVGVNVAIGVGVGVGVGPPLPYVNEPAAVKAWLSGFFTRTSTTPSACAPVVAVMDEELTTLTPVAATPPIATVAPDRKFAPVIVTGVPPAPDPEAGSIEEMEGPGRVPKQDVRPST